jgi:thiol:disulfide interchange protein DsbD
MLLVRSGGLACLVMIARMLLTVAAASGALAAPVRSGKVAAEWLAASVTCEAGKPVATAIRMLHDDGWHSYWHNPGEAGMPTTVEWHLPAGWRVMDARQPAPERFETGGLVGFGYGGTVLWSVSLAPPADFTGTARLEAVLSWLACSEDGCVPGEARLVLELAAGPAVPGANAALIESAMGQVPRPAPGGLRLEVKDEGARMALTIHAADGGLDLGRWEVFPATPDLIDPRAVIRFESSGGAWTATAPKSQFAKGRVTQLVLVLKGGGGPPMELSWTAP